MRRHRFIGNFNLSSEHLIVDDAELVSQLSKVLRLAEGDEVVLCDGKGFESKAEIRSLRKMSVSFALLEKRPVEAEPMRDVTLYCSILKRENFELVAQKATEVGVKTLVPILSARTVKQVINPKRLAKVVKEAAEQSGRGVVPELKSPLSLAEAFEEDKDYDEQFFFHLEGEGVERRGISARSCALYIGPEGGWDESEVQLAREKGCTILSLGSTTLRAETAAIIGSYLALHAEKQ